MNHFASRFTGLSGIASLMEDLGDALNNNPDMIFMGGGNPAQIPAVEGLIQKHLKAIHDDQHALHKLVGEYQPPQGDPAFLNLLAEFFNVHYNWPVSAKNIAVSNGGQSAFFALFNMLADQDTHITLPLVPDYLGYADAGMYTQMFKGFRPTINRLDTNTFKYGIDFDALTINHNTATVCVSRPANPSGNVITNAEITQLKALCKPYNIPLIIDAAYGKPFPGITFVEHDNHWDEDTIMILSLSKLGLPGVRTGLVIAHEDHIKKFSRVTASTSLAPGNLGPSIAKSLLSAGELLPLCHETITPYYFKKMQQTVAYIKQKSAGMPVNIHKAEGAFFLWLWFEHLPITSQELYQRLKQKGVLIISGHHFFQTSNNQHWQHHTECVRLSYCQPWHKVQQGIDILLQEVALAYKT